jgi:hypothetical protein
MIEDGPARRVMLALTVPAGARHIVTVLPADVPPGVPPVWSTRVGIGADDTVDIENPTVATDLSRIVAEGGAAAVIVRTFTDEISHVLPNGVQIPIKEVRGWRLDGGVFHPFDEQAIFAASCTDAATGEPIPPERGVRYADAHPVRADEC